MNKPLLIIGGSGHGSIIAACVNDNRSRFGDLEWEVKGFINDIDKEPIDGYPVVGNLSDIDTLIKEGYYFSWGIHLIQRSPLTEELYLKHNISDERLATIIHKSAFVSNNAVLMPGVFVMYNAYVSPRVIIGKSSMVKANAMIGHDVKCGHLCHFAMGSITGAFTEIGNCADIATGCVILENKKIGNFSFAGANSLVSHDIPDYEIHVGAPAKFLKKVRVD